MLSEPQGVIPEKPRFPTLEVQVRRMNIEAIHGVVAFGGITCPEIRCKTKTFERLRQRLDARLMVQLQLLCEALVPCIQAHGRPRILEPSAVRRMQWTTQPGKLGRGFH